MPFKKVITPNIDRKFSMQISTPTSDLSTAQNILTYLNPYASYNLIPGIQNTTLLDPERILLQILPHTTNIMIDLTMPYIEITKKKNALKHLARYIISNKQLIGIRIKPSDNWVKSKTVKQPISQNLQSFYQQQGIKNYEKEILVGQFLVSTKHFKLAPLFASELSSMFQNITINMLNDYYSLGCQVFSIVNDLNEQKRKTLKEQVFINCSPFEILRNYRRQSTVVLYSGMHLALDLNDVYKTKSYAIQSSSIIKKIHVNNLDHIYTEEFIADFNQTKNTRKLNYYNESKIINSDIQILDCSHMAIKFSFQSLQSNRFNRFEQPMDEQNQINDTKTKLDDIILYLWHLYMTVNKKTPFVLPCPFNHKDQYLLKNISLLSAKSRIPQTDLVQFIKLDSKSKLPKKYQLKNFKYFFLQRILSVSINKFYIYFNLRERITINSIEKDEDFLNEVQKFFINCSGCIPDELYKLMQSQNVPAQVSVADEDQKFIQKFLKRKNGLSLESFYLEIAKYYPRTKLNVQFMQNMFECLQIKIKKQFIASPFQNFVLQCSFDEIKYIFADVQRKFFSKDSSLIPKAEQDPNQAQQQQNQLNNFRNHIKKVRYHCNTQKKNNNICHICNSLFHKKEKSTYGRFCVGCNNFVCYSCFDQKTGQTAQNQQSFQQCLVCQNKCDCQKCLKKKQRTDNYYQFKNQTLKNSQIFESFKDLGTSDNVSKNQPIEKKSSFIKSEMLMERETKNFGTFENDSEIVNSLRQTIKACWTCQLSNRVDRIITFQCQKCKGLKCYSCQKFELPHRNWVLRGSVICNKCFQAQRQHNELRVEIKNLKGKNVVLQHENALLQRQKINSTIFKQSSTFQAQGYENMNEFYQASETNSKNDKGGMTPLFERSSNFGTSGNQSPNPYLGRKNPSDNGSIASFGCQRVQNINQFDKKNDENSSVSMSVASKRSQPETKNEKKRKNSSGSSVSSKKSLASFKNKPSKALSNSSRGSKASRRSIESGQFQQSSSSKNNDKFQPKKNWTKNYHQKDFTQEEVYETRKDFSRGRGRGRGGYQNYDQRDNKKWDSAKRAQNKDDNKNQYQNKRKQGFQGKSWQRDDNRRNQGKQGFNSNKRDGWNKFNDKKDSERYENNNYNRQQQSKTKNDNQQSNYYLGKIGNNTNNDEDFDY